MSKAEEFLARADAFLAKADGRDRVVGHHTLSGMKIPIIEKTPSMKDILYGASVKTLRSMGTPEAAAELKKRGVT